MVKASLFRGNGVSRSTQSLSPCRSRTSQVHGCLRRLLLVPPEFHGYSSGQARRARKRSLRGYTWALSVLIRTLLTEGMAYGHAKVETSCLLLHVLVACTLVELRQAFRRRKRQRWECRVARVLSVGWFDLIRNLDTSLVVFLRSICSGLGISEGGRVYGLFSKEGLYVGKAFVNRTHCPGLAARLPEHIRCPYRPGLKDANKPRYRFLRRRLWGVRFFPLAVFPTISQTLAAEALAISMELRWAMRRMRRRNVGCATKGTMSRSGLLVDGRRAGDGERGNRGKVFGVVLLSNKFFQTSPGKPVQFPGALGLDIPFSSFYTAQIREQHAYWGSQVPLYLFDPCRLGRFWHIARKVRTDQTSHGSGSEVALVGNCIISVWCVQTGFRVPQASLQTVFCLPSSGLSSSFSFPATHKGSSFSGASSCQSVGLIKR